MKRLRSPIVRILAALAFCAIFGFCYTIATQASTQKRASRPHTRALGDKSLRYLNPALDPVNDPDDNYDLGDAYYGSNVTRYVTATGGLHPYTFSSTDLTTVVGNTSTLTLFKNGALTGLAPAPSALTDAAFTVGVTDGTGPVALTITPLKTFHVGLFPFSASIFRFGVDRINNGVLGQSYIGKVEAIGGKGTVKYSILPNTITLNGLPYGTGTSLESLGLCFADDGTVYGRPLQAGLIGFTARAIDAKKRIATSRVDELIQDQDITFNIEDSSITATDGAILTASVTGLKNKVNYDVFSMKLTLNLGASYLPAGTQSGFLAGKPVAVRIGTSNFEGYIDKNGRFCNIQNKAITFPDGSHLIGSITYPNNTMSVSVTNADFSTALDTANIQQNATKRVPIAVLIGNSLVACDFIEFVSSASTTRYSLKYTYGKVGRPLGGVFMVYYTKGQDRDDVAGNPGDIWSANFLAAPRYGIDADAGFDAIDTLDLSIGRNPNDPNQDAVFTLNGSDFTTAKDGSQNYKDVIGTNYGVRTLKLSEGAMSGSVVFYAISKNVTGIAQVKDTTTNVNVFDFGLKITRNDGVNSYSPFEGENSHPLYRTSHRIYWVDTVLLSR